MSTGKGMDADGGYRGGPSGCGQWAIWIRDETRPDGKVRLDCHRSASHSGSHLDTERDVWYSKDKKGVMHFFPRRLPDKVPTSNRRVTGTRKGM